MLTVFRNVNSTSKLNKSGFLHICSIYKSTFPVLYALKICEQVSYQLHTVYYYIWCSYTRKRERLLMLLIIYCYYKVDRVCVSRFYTLYLPSVNTCTFIIHHFSSNGGHNQVYFNLYFEPVIHFSQYHLHFLK